MRIAVCGLGMMGQAHLANVCKLAELELAAVCDSDPDKLGLRAVRGNLAFEATAASLDGVPAFTEFDRMLRETELDAVAIATPTDLHSPLARAALEAGLHVFCEKPIAVTVPEAERVCRAAARSGRVLLVGHVLRFFPAYQRLRELVRSRDYGPVVAAEFSRSCGLPGWGGKGWFADPARSGGMPVDLHIHDADFVRHALGAPPQVRSFRRRHDGLDVIRTLYMYKDALVASSGAWVHRSAGFAAWAKVTFERATVAWHSGAANHLDLFPAGAEPEVVDLPPVDGYEAELREFVRCASEGRPSDLAPPESALDALRMVYAEMDSARLGRPVACP
jgi:predicted dehydrogenase